MTVWQMRFPLEDGMKVIGSYKFVQSLQIGANLGQQLKKLHQKVRGL